MIVNAGVTHAAGAAIVLRADASAEIGGGHVMRLLALADAHKQEGGASIFALNRAAAPFHELLVRRGHEVVSIAAASGSAGDIEAVDRLRRERAGAPVVLDGSFAGLPYERELTVRGGGAVIAIDDGAGRVTAAHILVNPNAGAELADYRGEGATRLLCGPRYALVRPEFLADRRDRQRPAGASPCLLVTFGTSDPEGGTVRTLRSLPSVPHLRVLVVLGAQHAGPDAALEAAEGAARLGHAVEVLCSPPDMAAVMGTADVAISAGGGTLLELACLGCPSLAFVVADNQLRGCRTLAEADCLAGGDDLRHLGDEQLAHQIAGFLGDRARWRRLADRARRLVDGLGAARVLSALQEHLFGLSARIEATA